MHAGQGEAGCGVIEGSHVRPGNGVMALGTIGDRVQRGIARVRRVIRLVVSGLVTAGVAAIGGLYGQSRIVIVQVTRSAGHRGVCVGQRETGAGVIEGRIGPTGRVVALRAERHREAGGNVVRNRAAQGGGAVPVAEVAAGITAIGRLDTQRVIIIDVAGCAGRGIRRNVHAG